MNMASRNVILITGAAGALGRAAAEAFEAAGAALILLDINLAALNQAYPDESEQRHLVEGDLLDPASVASAVETGLKVFGRIDVLCNMAGGFYYGEPVHETRQDVWLQQFHVNATTVVNAVRGVVPHMVCRGKGTVFNIGAAAHLQGHGRMSAYAVGKSAVMRLTESMAEELRDTGVNVLCLMPSIIDTPKNRADMPQADPGEWTPAPAIAQLMVLLTTDAASLMSGSCIPLNGRPRSSAVASRCE